MATRKLDRRTDIQALAQLIEQADLALCTNPTPHPSITRCRELLSAAVELARDLLQYAPTANPAVEMGAKGGIKTAERGSEYFKKIAAMRKTKAGGRPKRLSGTEQGPLE